MKKILFLFLVFIFAASTSCYCAKFSFAVLGDNRDGDQAFKDIIKNINKDKSIKFVVNTGDLTPNGWTSEYNKYWQMCGTCKAKIYDTIGNHDLGILNAGAGIFKKKYGDTYYYFDRGGARFIILDNSRSRGMGRKQFVWLKDVLDTKKMKFVFIHKPIFDPTGAYPNYIMTPKDEVEALNKLLIREDVKYVFAGHIHGYGREERDGITYILTAGAGAPLYLPAFNGGYYHYVKVTVDGSKITDKVVKIYND